VAFLTKNFLFKEHFLSILVEVRKVTTVSSGPDQRIGSSRKCKDAISEAGNNSAALVY